MYVTIHTHPKQVCTVLPLRLDSWEIVRERGKKFFYPDHRNGLNWSVYHTQLLHILKLQKGNNAVSEKEIQNDGQEKC